LFPCFRVQAAAGIELMDEDVVEASEIAKSLGVTIHVRGTDEAPRVVLLDKRTGKMVGGIELKERIRRFNAKR
jgi:hypothetical protein